MAGSRQHVGHRVVAFVASVFVNLLGRLAHRNLRGPRLGERRGIVDRKLVHQDIGRGAREALGQLQLVARSALARLVGEVGGLHHQRVAFPMTARIA